MNSATNKFNYKNPYDSYFGGVSALTGDQFIAANGFSNIFFGWGGEDDDFANRLMARGKTRLLQLDPERGRYA